MNFFDRIHMGDYSRVSNGNYYISDQKTCKMVMYTGARSSRAVTVSNIVAIIFPEPKVVIWNSYTQGSAAKKWISRAKHTILNISLGILRPNTNADVTDTAWIGGSNEIKYFRYAGRTMALVDWGFLKNYIFDVSESGTPLLSTEYPIMDKYLFIVPHGVSFEDLKDALVPKGEEFLPPKFKNGVWFVPTSYVPKINYTNCAMPVMGEMSKVVSGINGDFIFTKANIMSLPWSRSWGSFAKDNAGFRKAPDKVHECPGLEGLPYDDRRKILTSLHYVDPESDKVYTCYAGAWYEVILPTEPKSIYKLY